MAQDVCADGRAPLTAIVADRNHLQKHVHHARTVLLSASAHRQPAAKVTCKAVSRPTVSLAGASIDHLVSPLEHSWRNDEAQGFGSPNIDR